MRFYVSPKSVFPQKNIISIRDKQELHHIYDVMRLRKGMHVEVFDGEGHLYSGRITEAGRGSVEIDIIKTLAVENNNSRKISLFQAIPKKSKMDFIIEKAVELGVDEVIPIVTDRTVPVIDKGRGGQKLERWSRIARSASKQCGRAKLPAISGIMHFEPALEEAQKSNMVVLAALDKEARPLKEILGSPDPKSLSVFIGPEGDFSEREISLAKSKGCNICSLGPLVLRVETAAIYTLSCINYEYTKKA